MFRDGGIRTGVAISSSCSANEALDLLQAGRYPRRPYRGTAVPASTNQATRCSSTCSTRMYCTRTGIPVVYVPAAERLSRHRQQQL